MSLWDPRSARDQPQVTYPAKRVDGHDYYSIAQILNVIYKYCDVEKAKTLCETALIDSPVGLQLRNDFLLPIRVELQEWHAGTTISLTCKMLLQRILEDTTTDLKKQKLDYNRLSLATLIAFDHTHEMKQAFGLEDG